MTDIRKFSRSGAIKETEQLKKGFTLLELIIAIIIIAVLATLGYSQYEKQVESTRLAEVKVGIGLMRQLAHEYYLKNGSLTGILNSDVGVDNTCTSTHFYKYSIWGPAPTWLLLIAERCTNDGKGPNVTRGYYYYLQYYPGTDEGSWHCKYTDDASSCFGLSP